MDYDDNDFESQNLYLAGEESAKKSPILLPYALTKFDFDEGLQGHLRFDSLVENEVFLGIPSQEDNHWIEGFSRGSSGIEFSSSAAESCSIVRHNNVWSEATSSASVEMLLNSVGQEEIVPRETIIEESDACHKLGNLTEQMEPHTKQDEKVMNITDLDPALPSDEPQEHFSHLNDVKSTSRTQEVEVSTHGGSHVLDPNASSVACGVYTTESNRGVNEKSDNGGRKDSSDSGVQIDDIGSSSQDNAANVEALNNQESENQVGDVHFENANCSLTDTGEAVGERHVLSKEVDMVDQNSSGIGFETVTHDLDNLPSFPSKVEPTERTIETGICNFETGKGNGSNTNNAGQHSRLTVACSSTEFHGQKHTTKNLEGIDDVSGVHKEDHNARDHVPFDTVGASMQTHEGNLVSNANEVHYDQDVSFHDKELPNDSVNMESETEIVESLSNDERVEPSSKGEGMKVNNVVVHGSEFDTTCGNANCVLPGTLDGTPSPSEAGAPEDEVMDQLNKNKRAELSLTQSPERASKVGPVLELEKGALHNSAQELSHEAVDQSLSAFKTCSLASGSKQRMAVGHSLPSSIVSQSAHAVKGNDGSKCSFNKLEVCSAICDSTAKQDSVHEGLIVAGNHEEAAVGKNHEVASSKVAGFYSEGAGTSADSDGPSCGMPNVISCIMLSHSEKDKKGGVNESMCRSGVPFYGITVQSTPQNVSRNDATKDEGSFTFQVHPSAGIPERETSKDLQSFTTTLSGSVSRILKGSLSAPGVGQMDSKTIPELSPGSSQAADQEAARGGSKGTAERKTRRASGKTTGKENAKKKGNVKETTPLTQSERGAKSGGVAMRPSGSSQLTQFEGLKPHGNVERCGILPSGVASIPASNLSELNTSTPPSALFQQPFTDLQQVQLRAQIFVYGSMIQGAAPDEACMVSAFGASDGGRSVWEPVWRACVEKKLRGQKSQPKKSESPVQLRSGAKPPDQSIKQGALQSKVPPSPVGQASNKATPSPVLTSTVPLSSPLWNVSTPSCDGLQSSGMPRSGLLEYHQTPPPLHSLQTPPTRSFVGLNTSWLSQAPFPSPWVASPQPSVFDSSARLSVLPITETMKLTSVKESSALFSSGAKHASHGTGPSVFAGSALPDTKKVIASSGQYSTDTKARKRKKVVVSEDPSQISVLAHTRTESVSVPLVTSHLSTSVVVSTPACFVSKGNASKIVTSVPPTFSTDPPKSGGQNALEKATISEDSSNKVEEAKRQAEDAAVFAAAAVSHSQIMWSQLDKQKSSGLIPDVEAKLASAAVAIAAAASVAKAAAAAANIASNAALQAKLMADEALISTPTSNPSQSGGAALSDVNLGKATPASILKGGDGSNSSSSIIVAAREAARRRVEAASAASKYAENLDAIVKAAELAAEAVSQAGKIVALGNPLSLNELLKTGPDACCRAPQVPPEQGDGNRELSKVGSSNGLNASGSHAKGGPLEEANNINPDLSPLSREFSRESLRAVDGVSSSFTSGEKDSRGQRSRRASDLAKTIVVVPESEIGSRSASITAQDEKEKQVGTLMENNIKEGCLVEVYKDGDQFKAAWYSANVLSLKDGKAFVLYSDLQSDNGSRDKKEWVTLGGEGNSAPRIRIDRRANTMRSEGTRKRRRAAKGDYAWSVGDRADAWIKDCWREGVVTDKNNKDDTSLTVHFPAEGERSVVRVWDLRPTLIWKDGEWIEWSNSRERDPSSQGDTPQEKRLKLGSSAIEGREKDNMSKNVDLVESRKPADSGLLPLSANEKMFHVGKNTRTEIKPDALGTVRNGLQKEGSRVIFGIPKPGKKRKFMDVSKHYVADRSRKATEPNDSIKLVNYLMPQGSGPRGWRNTKFDAKAKQPAESNPKVLKSGKLRSVSGRSLPQRDNLWASGLSAQNEGTETDHVIKDSVITNKNESGQQNVMEFGSFSNTDRTVKSHAPSKKIPTSNAKSERVNKEKIAPSTGKLGDAEVKDKLGNDNPGTSIPDVVEPRRSNRRIQPTSRLLEGLQSSLMISKIPAVSHDKSHRSQNRGTSKGKS